jgi:hypothetical protein
MVGCKRVLGIEIGYNSCSGCVVLVAPICLKSLLVFFSLVLRLCAHIYIVCPRLAVINEY